MVFRLYKIDSKTGKCTNKKRDYPSEAHFIKYGLQTYKSYNREFYFTNQPTGTKAKLCFLNDDNKWEEVDKEYLNKLINK